MPSEEESLTGASRTDLSSLHLALACSPVRLSAKSMSAIPAAKPCPLPGFFFLLAASFVLFPLARVSAAHARGFSKNDVAESADTFMCVHLAMYSLCSAFDIRVHDIGRVKNLRWTLASWQAPVKRDSIPRTSSSLCTCTPAPQLTSCEGARWFLVRCAGYLHTCC